MATADDTVRPSGRRVAPASLRRPAMSSSPAPDDRLFVLAFYVVVDVSYSMDQIGAMTAVNDIMPKVVDAIEASPTLADVVRLGAMDFADDARVVLRLGDVRDFGTLPAFVTR